MLYVTSIKLTYNILYSMLITYNIPYNLSCNLLYDICPDHDVKLIKFFRL